MKQKQLLELLARRVRSRVLRGGSWGNLGGNCRSDFRLSSARNWPDPRNDYLGFRMVLIRRNHDTKTTP